MSSINAEILKTEQSANTATFVVALLSSSINELKECQSELKDTEKCEMITKEIKRRTGKANGTLTGM